MAKGSCRQCKHVIPSNMVLSQGLCNAIVPIGHKGGYDDGKLTLASEQIAGILSEEPIWLMVDLDNFTCALFDTKPVDVQIAPQKMEFKAEKAKVEPKVEPKVESIKK